MSMSESPSPDNAAVKNRRQIQKNADTMYQRSFGDLPDGTIYRDPAGWKSGDGSAEFEVNLQRPRWGRRVEIEGSNEFERLRNQLRKKLGLTVER